MASSRGEVRRYPFSREAEREGSALRSASRLNNRGRQRVAHLFQVGAGSGGMPVLDMLSRDRRLTRVTLVEPDIFKPHNVERHLFGLSGVGQPKAELARKWLF